MPRDNKFKDIEEFPRRIKIFFIIIFLLFLFGTFAFRIISEDTLSSSFYRTVKTIALSFKEESSLSEYILEIFLATIGVFLVWWVLWSISDMLLAGNLRKYLKMRFYSNKIRNMKNHCIIVGGGRVGNEIARVLSKKNKSFLIIETDSKVVASLKKQKYTVIEGDALNDEILKKANISTASKIIITLPQTETNILLTLTAKELNSKVEVHARCENLSLVSKLKRAGAEVVTVPEIVAADKIANDLGI